MRRHAHLFSLVVALQHLANLFFMVRPVQTTLRITDGPPSVLQFRLNGSGDEEGVPVSIPNW